jgi:hypothetical protein
MKLCTPAIVYLVLAIIALIFNIQYSFLSIFLHVIFIGLWTFILNWICKKGFVWISWTLVVLPYLFAALVWLIAIEIIAINKMSNEGFTDSEVTELTPEKIEELSESDIQSLTPEQIKGLTRYQLKVFTPLQISSFTQEQRKLFKPFQIMLLTPEQITAFSSTNNDIPVPS